MLSGVTPMAERMSDPGDGSTECAVCGKWVFPVLHSCTGLPVTIAAMARAKRACYLSPPDLHRLDWACRPILEAFGTTPYLVGSVLIRPEFRDIDLRLILPDSRFAQIAGSEQMRLLLNIALSDLIARGAGLSHPIDFQIQSQSEANAIKGSRNPMGMRWQHMAGGDSHGQ